MVKTYLIMKADEQGICHYKLVYNADAMKYEHRFADNLTGKPDMIRELIERVSNPKKLSNLINADTEELGR